MSRRPIFQVYAFAPQGTQFQVFNNGGAQFVDDETAQTGSSATFKNKAGTSFAVQGFNTSYMAASAGPSLVVDGLTYWTVDEFKVTGHADVSGEPPDNTARTASVKARFSFQVFMVGKAIEPAPAEPGDGQTWFPGQQLPKPLQVIVVDGQTRAPQGSVQVSFSTTSTPAGGANAFISPTTAQTDAVTGITSTRLTLGASTGSYKVRADCASCANGSFTFNALALSTPVATSLIEVFCGGNQFVNKALPDRLMVRAHNTVTDQPVAGFTVNFTTVSHPPGSPGSLNPASTATDSQGVAGTSFTVGSATGTYAVQAVCPDCLANTTVTCTPQGILPPDLQPPPEPVVQIRQRRSDFSVVAVPPEVAPVIPPDQSTAPYPVTAALFVSGASTGAALAAAVSAQPGSGGHGHVPPPPRPVGSLHDLPASIGASGIGKFVYISTVVGGQEFVDVELTDAQGAKTGGNVGIPVKIPGLQKLPWNPTIYWLASGDPTHPDFVYGTQNLISTVTAIAAEFKSRTTSQHILSFNDISLINGGVFDTGDTWHSPHISHRRGIDFDLNSRLVNAVTLQVSTVTVNVANVLDIISDFHIQCSTVTEPEKEIHFRCP